MTATLALALAVLALGAGAEDDPADDPGVMLIDEYLKGKVTALEDGVLEVRYDFEDAAQLEDWVEYKPFRVGGKLEISTVNRGVQLKGVGALHHKVGFTGQVKIECSLRPLTDRDLGFVVSENIESENYVLYSVNDIYFQRFDGASTPQHMVTRFGIQDDSDRVGDRAFRYICRGREPKIQTYQILKASAEKDGKVDTFHLGDTKYSGKEPGRLFEELLAGLYVVKATAQYSDIVVRGKVSKGWLDHAGVELKLAKPLNAPAPEVTQAEKDAQKLLQRFDIGAAGVEELIPVIDNPEVTVDTREQAAAAILATGNKKLTPNLVGLLYSEDLDTRSIGNDLVKGLTGKSFGYDPKADEEKRSRAIVKIVQYLQKYPRKFGTGH